MEANFKIKPLTESQIIISLDRLTRFKPTEEKYLRVFKDIITSNLIYPKYKKSELDLIDYEILTQIVEVIFSASLTSLNCSYNPKIIPKEQNNINKKLLEYEKYVFKFDNKVQKLLNNKIDYITLIKMFDMCLEKAPYNGSLPLNLQWLQSLSKSADQIEDRVCFGLKFPLQKIILVEGITEEILLPKFALMCGLDFDKAGIHLISAGGKNQVVKIFYQFSNILKLPMFVLLDNDAVENFEEITPKLRKKDKVHVLKCGEFEDALPINLIKRTLNRHFKNYFSISLADLRKDLPMTKTLEELFRERGLEFKKAEFASLIEKNVSDIKDVSEEIKFLIEEIKN